MMIRAMSLSDAYHIFSFGSLYHEFFRTGKTFRREEHTQRAAVFLFQSLVLSLILHHNSVFESNSYTHIIFELLYQLHFHLHRALVKQLNVMLMFEATFFMVLDFLKSVSVSKAKNIINFTLDFLSVSLLLFYTTTLPSLSPSLHCIMTLLHCHFNTQPRSH